MAIIREITVTTATMRVGTLGSMVILTVKLIPKEQVFEQIAIQAGSN
jgi:hypothetical protein